MDTRGGGSRLTWVRTTKDMSPKSRMAARRLYDVNNNTAQSISVLSQERRASKQASKQGKKLHSFSGGRREVGATKLLETHLSAESLDASDASRNQPITSTKRETRFMEGVAQGEQMGCIRYTLRGQGSARVHHRRETPSRSNSGLNLQHDRQRSLIRFHSRDSKSTYFS